MSTNKDGNYENITITLPKGLRDKAKNAGLNVSATCADALARAVTALNKRKEFEAWCASNPGNAYHNPKGDA